MWLILIRKISFSAFSEISSIAKPYPIRRIKHTGWLIISVTELCWLWFGCSTHPAKLHSWVFKFSPPHTEYGRQWNIQNQSRTNLVTNLIGNPVSLSGQLSPNNLPIHVLQQLDQSEESSQLQQMDVLEKPAVLEWASEIYLSSHHGGGTF